MQNRKKCHVTRGIFISVSRAHFAHGDLLKIISKYRVDSLISESFHIQMHLFQMSGANTNIHGFGSS